MNKKDSTTVDKKDLSTVGLMTMGAIGAAVVNETMKSSLNVDDVFVSLGATAVGIFFASKAKGKTRDFALGATTLLGMNAISDSVSYAAQKTENPMIDKLSELLPTVNATNLLANPDVDLSSEQDALNYEYTSPATTENEGVNGLNNLNALNAFNTGVA